MLRRCRLCNERSRGGSLSRLQVTPFQGYDNSAQPVGSLLAWPSLVTHPHEANQLTRGVKYGLTIWCELPGDAAIY